MTSFFAKLLYWCISKDELTFCPKQRYIGWKNGSFFNWKKNFLIKITWLLTQLTFSSQFLLWRWNFVNWTINLCSICAKAISLNFIRKCKNTPNVPISALYTFINSKHSSSNPKNTKANMKLAFWSRVFVQSSPLSKAVFLGQFKRSESFKAVSKETRIKGPNTGTKIYFPTCQYCHACKIKRKSGTQP